MDVVTICQIPPRIAPESDLRSEWTVTQDQLCDWLAVGELRSPSFGDDFKRFRMHLYLANDNNPADCLLIERESYPTEHYASWDEFRGDCQVFLNGEPLCTKSLQLPLGQTAMLYSCPNIFSSPLPTDGVQKISCRLTNCSLGEGTAEQSPGANEEDERTFPKTLDLQRHDGVPVSESVTMENANPVSSSYTPTVTAIEPSGGTHQLLTHLRHSAKFADVVFASGDRIFLAHKDVLAYHSDVLETICQGAATESPDGKLRIELDQCLDPRAIEAFLDFLYFAGRVDVQHHAVDLFHLAKKYQIGPLAGLCEPHLINDNGAFTVDNVWMVVDATIKDNSYRDIQMAAANFVARNAVAVVKTTVWKTRVKPQLGDYCNFIENVIMTWHL